MEARTWDHVTKLIKPTSHRLESRVNSSDIHSKPDYKKMCMCVWGGGGGGRSRRRALIMSNSSQ